jgi:hypothetical protein
MKTTTSPDFEQVIRNAISVAKGEVAKITKLIVQMEAILDGDGNHVERAKPEPKPHKPTRARGRRSPEQVTKQAHEMLAFIKKAGDAGVSGKEINSKFGKVVGTTKAFVESRTGEKVKTTGKKSAMRYFAV